LSWTGAPIRPDRANDLANPAHLFNTEPVAAHQVAFSAGGLNVAFGVGQAVVDPIQTAICAFRAAVNAR
jgi:hypothetical protein